MNRSILFALLLAFSIQAQSATPKITGVFSSMRFGTEDVTGVEVFITYSGKGYFAQVQCAEGAISQPIIIPVRVNGLFVEFDIPSTLEKNNYACPAGKFEGKLSFFGLKGHFEGTKWPGLLKRKSSYWQ